MIYVSAHFGESFSIKRYIWFYIVIHTTKVGDVERYTFEQNHKRKHWEKNSTHHIAHSECRKYNMKEKTEDTNVTTHSHDGRNRHKKNEKELYCKNPISIFVYLTLSLHARCYITTTLSKNARICTCVHCALHSTHNERVVFFSYIRLLFLSIFGFVLCVYYSYSMARFSCQ